MMEFKEADLMPRDRRVIKADNGELLYRVSPGIHNALYELSGRLKQSDIDGLFKNTAPGYPELSDMERSLLAEWFSTFLIDCIEPIGKETPDANNK